VTPAPRVYVAFDYGCAYSAVGFERVRRLDERVDVEWVWLPWEMYPSIPEDGDPIDGVDAAGEHPVGGLPGRLADEADETLYWPPAAPNAELAAIASEAGFGPEIFEAAPDAIVADASGTIVLANSQVEELFGWERDRIVGEEIEVLVPDRFEDVHAGHRDEYMEDPTVRPTGAASTCTASARTPPSSPSRSRCPRSRARTSCRSSRPCAT